MASTFASASRSAAGSITEASNWFSAAASSAISVTRKREKCAVTSATPASIALVTGSSTELEDGVIMPRRLRTIDIDRSRSVAAKALLRFLKRIIRVRIGPRNPQSACCIQFIRYARVLSHIRLLFGHLT
jgi:hypothetical protein